MTLAGLAVRNLARNRFRVVLTVLGVAVAILAFLLLRTVIWAWSSAGEWAAKDRVVTRHKVTFVMSLPKRYVEVVRNSPHVKSVTWANWFGGKDPKHDREFFAALGADAATYFTVYDDMGVQPDQLETFKHDRQGAIVGDVLAKKLGWKVGDRVALESGIYPGDWQFNVDAIYQATSRSANRSTFVFHWDYLNDSLPPERRDQVGWIVSRVDDPAHVADMGVALDKRFEDLDTPTLSQDERSFNASFLAMFSEVLRAMNVISVVILIIMALILGNTIAMGVRERTSEYGVLRAIGFLPVHVVMWVVGESLVMGALGGALGVAFAWPFINLGVGRFIEENMGSFFPYFRLETANILLGLFVAALIGGLAAAIPAWRASKLDIVNAVRRVGVIPLRYNIRSLAVRKATTVATAGGIALVVFVLASSMMLTAGIRKTLGASGRADNAIVLRMGSDAELGSVIEESAVPIIFAAPGVKADERGRPLGAAEVIVVGAMEKLGADGVTNVSIRGVGDDVMHFRPEVHLIAGRPPRPGSDEAIVGARIRGRIRGVDLGQSFDIKKNRPVTVVGVFEAGGSSYESEVWVDRDVLRQAYGRDGVESAVRVRLTSPTMFDAFRAGVENEKRLGLQAVREQAFYEKQSEGASQFFGVLGGAVSFFFAVGAMIGAMITMYAAVANRQREIGTLRALGFSRSSVLTSFLIEAVVLAVVGGGVGALASLSMGLVHLSMVNQASWSEVVFSFDPTPKILAIALAFACGMGLVGGLFPAVRAARTSPLKAIRG